MIRFVYISFVSLLLLASMAHAQNAADAYYDPTEMAEARAHLKAENGGKWNSFVLGERLEYQSNDGDALAAWAGQGWFGGDVRRVWFKTESEYATAGNRVEEAELQALYSQAVSPFWDLQAGFRYDIKPDPSRTYAVLGFQGLAPYWFELDGSVFLSDKGDLSSRLEAEYEFRLTQRLMLQPRLELNAAFSDDEATGVGSGLSTVEAGLRLRYEVKREFAPYLGINWSQAFGDTKDFRRSDGEDTGQVSFVAGVRFWF